MEFFNAPTIYGEKADGGAFSENVYQGDQPTCAVHSQYNVLKDYGFKGSVDDLIKKATEKGWYNPAKGTPTHHIGKLLEEYGVPCDMYINANKYNLISELAKGKKIIVTVDAGELWYNEEPLDDLKERILGKGADHALVVTGIDTTDPRNITVTLTDSGTGQAAVSYPLAQFEDAWNDGRCTMIVPHSPPPLQFAPQMVNFDYTAGHVAHIGDKSFDEWQDIHKDQLDIFEKIEMPDSGMISESCNGDDRTAEDISNDSDTDVDLADGNDGIIDLDDFGLDQTDLFLDDDGDFGDI